MTLLTCRGRLALCSFKERLAFAVADFLSLHELEVLVDPEAVVDLDGVAEEPVMKDAMTGPGKVYLAEVSKTCREGELVSNTIVIESTRTNILVKDTGVVVPVSSRQANEVAGIWCTGLGAADFKLRARGIELGAALGYSEVESNDLVADEVVACFEVGGEGHFGCSASH